MRSELIFRARQAVDNKYELCQTVSKATRCLHVSATSTTDTINDAFSRIAGGDQPLRVENPVVAALYGGLPETLTPVLMRPLRPLRRPVASMVAV
jgi:hypothetical protein